MTPSLAAPLRDALLAADFTYDAVAELLGAEAHSALSRNETTPALRRAAGGGPLATLVRLFLLQRTVPFSDAERALPGLVDRLAADGLLTQSGGEVAARLDCRPYSTEDAPDLWVVSDLTPGMDGAPQRVTTDYVLGISPASTSLAQLTLRHDVASALDLGTGCGVQALHLAGHADRVVATDVNPRALDLARFNAELNEVGGQVDVRDGSFFAPVAGERFDLITTNPPFVISPATGRQEDRLVYRDSGLPGDQAVEHVVRTAPAHLADSGWCQVLANWAILADRPWDERLADWLPDDCDALVVQREVLDPAAYVELWLKDSGHHPSTGTGTPAAYTARYDAWLSWLEEQGVAGIGFGWINLHRTGVSAGSTNNRREVLEWPYDVEQPIAPAVADWARAGAVEVGPDTTLVVRPDVRQETVGPVGAEDPATILLRQQRGLRRARQVDTVVAAVVGACDGELPVGAILDAVAQLLGLDAAATKEQYLPELAAMVGEGYLVHG
ncbi:class I SAM-dependent methyltransferase [Nocardioides immobilis]|uniref:Class I SAM-dependent methyltransferase n=1 Tax=Nocardioides immobilis TaxID=2049295 RepID=A0A417Y2K0_9ACTN|nr:class I SAM-dependent methyltransferase [Nocardioides immobilis]RHW26787.1 class I SAM-dependent methyltransferase [Nocardioides immobilis]